MYVNTDTRKHAARMEGADVTGPECQPQAVLFCKTAATYECACEVLDIILSFKKIPGSHTHIHTHMHITAQRQGWGAILSTTIPPMSMS
jgi:hypothetical protein